MRGVMIATIALTTLAGCAGVDSDRRGVTGPVKYRNMSCGMLDRERVKVEQGAGRLFLSLRRKGALGKKSEAETLALWPTLIFLKGPSSRDQAEYRRLDRDYALLTRAAREQGCRITFVENVAAAVRAGRSPPTARINTVVKEETKP